MPVLSLRANSVLDPVDNLVRDFQEAWRQGRPPLERFRERLEHEESVYGLAELVKADLQERYQRGERPSAREYFDRFPDLAGENGHALSLIYEEFCLRAEMNEEVAASEFCNRYETWRDSLVSQLVYHRELSLAVEPAPTGPDLPEEGQRFGDYSLVKLLGQGGAAKVFLAHALQLGGKEVVLKISLDRGRESEVLGKLDHDHIVAVYTTVVDPITGLRGLCMPYRPGLPLDNVLKRFRRDGLPHSALALENVVRTESPDPQTEARRGHGWADFPAKRSYADGIAWMGMKLAGALAHAHSQGIFHRDVKPDNILLSCRDGPQLLDFNLAHDSTHADQARAAHRGGTLPYMAREQLQAFLDPKLWNEVGAPADLFSLGLILREMLSLKPLDRPIEHGKLARTINDLVSKRAAIPVPIRRFNRKVPHGLEAIVSKCLAEFPQNRYQTAQGLVDDLRAFLDRRPLKIAHNPSLIEVTCNRFRRQARIAGMTIAVLLLSTLMIVNYRVPALVESPIGATMNLPGVDAFAQGKAIPLSQHVFDPPATPATLEMIDQAEIAHEQKQVALSEELFQKALSRPDAISAFRLESERHRDSFVLKMGFAKALFVACRYEEAEGIYSLAIKLDPKSSSAIHGRATVEMSQDQFKKALESINKAMALYQYDKSPESKFEEISLRLNRTRILMNLGDKAVDKADYESAQDYFTQAVADLDAIGTKREVTSRPRLTFAYHFYSAISHGSLGQIEKKRDQVSISDKSYDMAHEHIRAARKIGVGQKESLNQLERQIKKLQNEGIAT